MKLLSYNVCHELFNGLRFMKHCNTNIDDIKQNICICNIEQIISNQNKYDYDFIALQELSHIDYDKFSKNFKNKINEEYHIIQSIIPNTNKLFEMNITNRSNMSLLYQDKFIELVNPKDISGGMVTLIKKNYYIKLLLSGDFGDKNFLFKTRLYQIILINNNIIFINIHGPHGKLKYYFNLLLIEFNKLIESNQISTSFNIIMCGDFNYDFYENRLLIDNYFKDNFAILKPYKFIPNNTCCHVGNIKESTFKYKSDNIFTTFKLRNYHVINIDLYKDDQFFYISDHKPISANIVVEYIGVITNIIEKKFKDILIHKINKKDFDTICNIIDYYKRKSHIKYNKAIFLEKYLNKLTPVFKNIVSIELTNKNKQLTIEQVYDLLLAKYPKKILLNNEKLYKIILVPSYELLYRKKYTILKINT